LRTNVLALAQLVRRGVYAALLATAVGCVRTTPFDADPGERDLTAKNLAELSARTPGSRFKFIALGDVHDEYDDLARTVEIINRRDDIEFVAVAGDMSDRGLRKELQWSQEILSGLKVPFLTAIGNHDAISSGAQIYRKMYGPLDYRFRFGGVEFVFFNSNSLEFPGEPVPNFAWLDQQLSAATDARALVLVTHYPPTFPPNKPEGTYDPAGYENLFAKHNVTLFVHSHLNDYGLWNRRGVVNLQCGTFQINRYYTVVTIDGRNVSLERCHFESCEPIEPMPETTP
jgi:Icc-related predicted phosphoesterase